MIKTIINFIKSLFVKEKEGDGKGWIEDLIDYRDIELGSIIKDHSPIPDEYTIPFKLTIKNQGFKPICVGMSGSSLKEFLERREQNYMDFDPQWLYNRCKEIDGIPDVRGTYFRTVLSVLKNTGAKPTNGKNYSPFRIGCYAKVKPKFNDIKEAIYRYGPVLLGFKGTNDGWKNAYIKPSNVGQRWGHAVIAIGFTKNHIEFKNSWGKGWGKNGNGFFDKNYLPISAYIALTDLPNNWKELLTKSETKYVFTNDLYFGMKNNEEVKILQKILKEKGCFPSGIRETGNYFSITKSAVKIYQARKGIEQVGRFGPKTRLAMNKDLSA